MVQLFSDETDTICEKEVHTGVNIEQNIIVTQLNE